MFGSFWGVGVGPGDPDLITVKAVEVLKEVDVIISPVSSSDEISKAEEIVKSSLPDCNIVRQIIPMTSNNEDSYISCVNKISNYIQQAKKIAFITIGDPLFFSTFIKVNKKLKELNIRSKIIPGIYSFSAIAAKTDCIIGAKNDSVAVLSSSSDEFMIEQTIKNFQTIIFIKPSRYIDKIKKLMIENNLAEHCLVVSNCGMENELIWNSILEIESNKLPYLSTIILRKENG